MLLGQLLGISATTACSHRRIGEAKVPGPRGHRQHREQLRCLSANVSSLHKHLEELAHEDYDVMVVQESRLTAQGQIQLARRAKVLGYTAICGKPAGQKRNNQGPEHTGVAALVRRGLAAVFHAATERGLHFAVALQGHTWLH